MQYDDFVKRVQQRTGIAVREDAALGVQATLETLGQCLPATEAADLAAQLPAEMKGYLDSLGPRREEPLSLADFVGEVSLRAGIDRPTAARYVLAVIAVLGEAVSIGELAGVLAHLPDEFRPFFEAAQPGLSSGAAQ